MLGSGLVDAVDICLPHHLHADAIVAAAEAGKHVLCEKPLCLTMDEARRVRAAVAASGITLMCSHNQLYMPPVAAARRHVQDGLLGTVYEARTTDSFYNDFDPSSMGWRASRATSGGGELIDTGYHPTYLLLYLVGRQPMEVMAMLSRHRLTFMEGEDSAQVVIRFEDGSIGSMVTSWAYQPAGSTERFSVVGEAGSLWSDGKSLFHRPRGGETVRLVEPADRGHRDDPAGRRRLRRVPARGPAADQYRDRGHRGPEGDPGGVRLGRAGPDHLACRRCSRTSPG